MAMTTDKKIYAALGVLVVLGGGLFALQKNVDDDAKAHSQAGASSNLPDIKIAADDIEKVSKIIITNGSKGAVTLVKDGGSWKLSSPVAYPANQQNVKSLLDNLKELKLKDVIDSGSGQYGTYEVDDKGVHLEVWKDADKALDLFFGKSGSRGQMTRVAGKDGVYVASGYSSYLYGREVKNWRDTEILKFEDANVISATLTNEHGPFSFSKNDDKWSGTYKKNAISDFDPEKVKDMLRAFHALNAEDFGDGKSPAETGLDSPQATLGITLKDNAGVLKLAVGKTSSGSSRYVQKEGNPTIFTISSWAADWAVAPVTKFQKIEAKDAGADKKK